MKIIVQKDWDYTFSQNERNEFILTVVCGSVGLYELAVLLNQEEQKQYAIEGEKFIESLVQKIRNNPNHWVQRKVN